MAALARCPLLGMSVKRASTVPLMRNYFHVYIQITRDVILDTLIVDIVLQQ